MLDHCLRYYQNGDLLSIPRRAVTSVFWSKSCARPRSTRRSNPQGPDRSPAAAEAAEAAPATTPALPTTSPKACSWHTRLLTPSHMCEAMDWNHRGKAGIEKCSFFVHIWNVLFLLCKHYNLGVSVGLFSLMCVVFSVFLCVDNLVVMKLLRRHNAQVFLNQNSRCWLDVFVCFFTVFFFSFWEGLALL